MLLFSFFSATQYDNNYLSADSNYARLSLGLVGRGSSKEQQQLLSIPRPTSGKQVDPLGYSRGQPSNAELELNMLPVGLQQSGKATNQTTAMSRRSNEGTTTATKAKRGRKSKAQQQQQAQQQQMEAQAATSIPGFPQYGAAPGDPIGKFSVFFITYTYNKKLIIINFIKALKTHR